MKHRRLLAILLALALMIMACACGASSTSDQGADSTAAAGVADAPEGDTSAIDSAPAADSSHATSESSVEAVEASSAEETTEEPAIVIEYPIPDGAEFTMVACRNNVTAEAYANGGFELTPVYDVISEATGVTFEFEMIAEQTYSEKINLLMSSGDLPDVINSNIGQYAANAIGAIEDDVLMDISDLLEENAPDYLAFLDRYPEVKVSVFNSDGSTSAFKSSAYPYKSKGLNIRRDWLDNLGMEVPTTLEELQEVLKAFKTEEGASMALLVTSELESGLQQYFQLNFNGFRSLSFQFTEPGSGEVELALASDECIEYLTYMHELYELGIVTNDFLNTGRSYGNFESSYLTGVSGIWEDSAMLYSDAFLARGEEGYVPEPFILENEERTHVSDVSAYDFIGGANYITTKCNDPVAACQFFNYCYTEAGQLLYNFGVEGVSYEYNAEGKIDFTENVTNNENGWALNVARSFYTGMWLCGEGMYRAVELQNAGKSMDAIQLWSDNSGDKDMLLPDGVTLTIDENTEFNTYAGDVLTTLSENASKAVVGDITIDDYKAILEQLKTGGLDTVTDIYQGAYDRYMESEG